jgi:CheY-like chemotaxis protein
MVALRILVIDDEAYARQLVRVLLEKEGYEVTAATSADEGLRLIRETRPDLVTLDLMMPGRDGLDMLAEKQADPAIQGIPCLVLSAVGLNADLDRALALGARATLSKPFSQRQLLDAVREVVGR